MALLKEIQGWLTDFEESQPNNIDIDNDTFEGSAYNLLVRCKDYIGFVEKTIDILHKRSEITKIISDKK